MNTFLAIYLAMALGGALYAQLWDGHLIKPSSWPVLLIDRGLLALVGAVTGILACFGFLTLIFIAQFFI